MDFCKILIVEDDKITAKLITSFIQKFGFEVSGTISSGKESIKAAEKLMPDLVLMDINLTGEMDGIDAANTIKNSFNIPIIYLTEFTDECTILRAVETDPYGYITKPFNEKDLFITIKMAIARKDLDRKFKETESRFYNFFTELQDALFIINGDGEFIDCNESMLNLFGYSYEEIQKLTLGDIFHNKTEIFDLRDKFDNTDKLKNFEISFVTKGNETITCLITAKAFRDPQGDVYVYQGIIHDISSLKKSEIEKAEIIEKLKQSMKGIIDTILTILESRDPYTASHQKRVAEIALEIAREMNLPEEQIEGIFLAATIHDIGKISIPAEILTKPYGISNDEFEMIKTHSELGYHILKNIDFSWPIAEIVYQHHERIDGRGYPRGLKENEILLEAKIIGVADVIEAMASHRPYRPALGIKIALDEIIDKKNKIFDGDVVDACCRVFKNNKYVISENF